MLAEFRHRVDHAEHLDDPRHTVEPAGGFAQRGQKLQPDDARMLVGILDTDRPTDLAGIHPALGPARPLAGEKDQRAVADEGNVVGDRLRNLRQHHAKLRKPAVGRIHRAQVHCILPRAATS